MTRYRTPGPLGLLQQPHSESSGTLCRTHYSPPGPALHPPIAHSEQTLHLALQKLDVETVKFSTLHCNELALKDRFRTEFERYMTLITSAVRHNKISQRQAHHSIENLLTEFSLLNKRVVAASNTGFFIILGSIKRLGGPTQKAAALLKRKFTQQNERSRALICLETIENLAPKVVVIENIMRLHEIQRWLEMFMATLVWTKEAARMQTALDWHPPVRADFTPPKSIPQPSRPRHESPPDTPVVVESATLDHVNQDQQAATLQTAAKNGIPFCEECEKARLNATAT